MTTQCRLEPAAAQVPPRPITYEEYCRACSGQRYLHRRWRYYHPAIEMACRLAPQRILEIGAAYLPLFNGSDTLDIGETYEPTYLHDAGAAPWPIKTNSYDLVIALQVWEHLRGRQREAFEELRRCTRYAILSLPYRWRHSNAWHNGIDDARVREWSGGWPWTESITVPQLPIHRRRRKIYLFDFTG